MSVWLSYLAWPLVLGGVFLTLVGAVGTLRFPDTYTRLHAVGVTDTLAAFLVLAGCASMALSTGDWLVAVKLLLVLIFVWFTSPIASYALAHAAFFDGHKPMLDNDLTEDQEGSV